MRTARLFVVVERRRGLMSDQPLREPNAEKMQASPTPVAHSAARKLPEDACAPGPAPGPSTLPHVVQDAIAIQTHPQRHSCTLICRSRGEGLPFSEAWQLLNATSGIAGRRLPSQTGPGRRGGGGDRGKTHRSPPITDRRGGREARRGCQAPRRGGPRTQRRPGQLGERPTKCTKAR